jgi:hypothetical protein
MTLMTWACWKMVVLLLTSGFFLGSKYTFLWSDISWHSCSKSQDLPTNLRLYKISLFWQQGIWFHSIKWVIFSQICEIELQFSFILFQWNHSWDTSKNHEKVSRVCHGHLSSLSFHNYPLGVLKMKVSSSHVHNKLCFSFSLAKI